jgi:hypothetical protein
MSEESQSGTMTRLSADHTPRLRVGEVIGATLAKLVFWPMHATRRQSFSQTSAHNSAQAVVVPSPYIGDIEEGIPRQVMFEGNWGMLSVVGYHKARSVKRKIKINDPVLSARLGWARLDLKAMPWMPSICTLDEVIEASIPECEVTINQALERAIAREGSEQGSAVRHTPQPVEADDEYESSHSGFVEPARNFMPVHRPVPISGATPPKVGLLVAMGEAEGIGRDGPYIGYRVVLEDLDGGEICIRGNDLEGALRGANAELGDKVSIQFMGRQRVMKNGRAVLKNTYQVEKLL